MIVTISDIEEYELITKKEQIMFSLLIGMNVNLYRITKASINIDSHNLDINGEE